MAVTNVAKDYLIAIAALAAEGKPVIGARLAERLNVTAPSVTQMLKRLEQEGLLRSEARRGIVLTEAGRIIADESARRLRLSERWLVEMLGLDWSEAQVAARGMEAAITPRVAERLAAVLGHPRDVAPGDGATGGVDAASIPLSPLDEIEAGVPVILVRIVEPADGPAGLADYLNRYGIRPGVTLELAAADAGAHTLTIRGGDQECVIGSRVASQVWVRHLTSQELARAASGLPNDCPDETDAFVAEVFSVVSECPAGHRLNDRFIFGQRTPCGMCADAFSQIYPRLEELRASGPPAAPLDVPCPEHGNVTFRVRRAREP